MTKTLVFIPSYNDHFHIDEIVEYTLNLSDRHLVLVVDDGSALPIKIKSGSKRVYSFRIPQCRSWDRIKYCARFCKIKKY